MPQPEFNILLIEEFRANQGKLTLTLGEFSLKDANMLLLNTTGARTGEPRTAPMGYWTDAGATYVMGIDRGQPKHPQWYWNILANPRVTVEIGPETYGAEASIVEGDDRERLLAKFIEQEPRMAFVATMKRKVPMFRLDRAEGA